MTHTDLRPRSASRWTSPKQENSEHTDPDGNGAQNPNDGNPQKDTVVRNQFSPPTSFTAFAPEEADVHVAGA